jgi:hypothetical protein
VKSIIVYTKELKAQNLYPKRIISPPAPNKCCPARMEVLGRPRLDEQGRRFYYKRCKVCGFALRKFLDPVGTILTPATVDNRTKKPTPPEAAPPTAPAMPAPPAAKSRPAISAHTPPRRPERATRKVAASRHARSARPSHQGDAGRKGAARRRR